MNGIRTVVIAGATGVATGGTLLVATGNPPTGASMIIMLWLFVVLVTALALRGLG